jgi:hypothetical protein
MRRRKGALVSYFVVYVMGEGEPRDGDSLATTRAWWKWSEWVVRKSEHYPQAGHLAEEGWLEPADALDELERELERLRHEGGPAGAGAITASLLEAVRGRPEGCTGLIISDGTAAGGEDEDEDEED